MPFRTEYEKNMLSGFTEAVNAIPGAHLTQEHVGAYDEGFDGVALFQLGSKKPRYFALEVKKNLYPRDLPQIVWTIKRNRTNHMGSKNLLVLLADTISNGAKEWMQAEGVGYYDNSGSLFLPTEEAYILIDRPTTKKQEKVIGSVFYGRRSEVLEALWERGRAWSSVKAIAERINAAPSLVSSTLQELERHDWIETQGNGPAKERRLTDWNGLLDAWTDHEQRRKPAATTKYFVPRLKAQAIPAALDSALAERRIDYEITGEFAGNVHAALFSSVSVIRARISAGQLAEAALEAIDARPVNEGFNLLSINESVELPFRRRIGELWIASPLRTYLDLLNTGGRGKDAAKMLREQKLQL
ncbi:hypothetical protein MMA231_04294 (plasmid) [Asticcacaulis sp. MM231]|uniref:winged helix-turn-helix domain-containing protein n=1 Tax=Asticcacaulis sp. MM231 TaxID=3157666 RepID=UPI0032D56848